MRSLDGVDAPLWKKIYTGSEYLVTSNCVFNFNFPAVVVSEILWSPKFTLRVPTPHRRPLAETFLSMKNEGQVHTHEPIRSN